LLALTLSACGTTFLSGERGSGNLITDTRQVEAFDGIDVSGAINLDVVVDPAAARSVTVTYDDNVIAHVVTRVQDTTLIIELDGNFNLTGNADRTVSVTTPELASMNASGATDVTVSGSTTSLTLDVSGASSIDLGGLTVADVALNASGASSVVVAATGVISGSASGASSIAVRGDPQSVRVETSGAASLDLP
jgi:hypothetical protein